MKRNSRRASTWSDEPSHRQYVYRAAADGGPKLRVPIDIQSRIDRDGQRVYRWKEKYDRGQGDWNGPFHSIADALADSPKRNGRGISQYDPHSLPWRVIDRNGIEIARASDRSGLYPFSVRAGAQVQEWDDRTADWKTRGSFQSNPPRGEVDEDAAAELMIYIVNTAELYDSNSMGASIEKNLAKKWKSGKFDPELAVKGYLHLVDAGAKRYVKEYGSSSPSWHEMFNVPTRRLVAQELVDAFVAEAKLGNFRG